MARQASLSLEAHVGATIPNGINGHAAPIDGAAQHGGDPKGLGDKTVPIAVVGMSCRFPGEATNPEALWEMLSTARDAWTPLREDRFSLSVKGAHFLKEDIRTFDAPFFNLTATEAGAMDPLMRLTLETSYEALENAGMPLDTVTGSDTGVFVGCFTTDFSSIIIRDPELAPTYSATGTGLSMLANRVSHFFDLKGPSITLDTACSSSLTALHLACQSLAAGETTQAIVGGTNVIFSPDFMMPLNKMRFLSPDGRCFSFDYRANGYGRGEGAACVVLKTLDQAIRDGNIIRAVIRNTNANQDGKTPGITLPSQDAQKALLARVYHAAGLDPMETGYVEAHGTGTLAGDPVEVGALSYAFCKDRRPDRPLIVGSVKTNIGHTEGASGIAGLLKAILMLEKKLIAPNCKFEKPNPQIPFDKWNIKIPTTVTPWNSLGVRRASVNSFGYGGANAHCILDNAQDYLAARELAGYYRDLASDTSGVLEVDDQKPSKPTNSSRSQVFVLSAAHEISAKRQVELLSDYLRRCDNEATHKLMTNLAYTLGERRTVFNWKMAVRASNAHELLDELRNAPNYTRSIKAPALGFVFTGQGAQWFAMGRELFETFPVYGKTLRRIDKYLTSIGCPWSLLAELSKDAKTSRLGEAALSQPMCTAVQIALVDLLASWRVKPVSVTGHSSGEIAAAYTVGALTLESAMTAAYHRGRMATLLRSKTPEFRGSMMAVGLGYEETNNVLSGLRKGTVTVACRNSPTSVTVSGDEAAITELQIILDEQNVFNRKLQVEVAYHSHHMRVIAEDYRAELGNLQTQTATDVDFYSSVTGTKLEPSKLGPDYWVENLLSEVRFLESLRSLCLGTGSKRNKRRRGQGAAVDVLVEVGPHAALAGPVREILQSEPTIHRASIYYTAALIRNRDAVTTMQEVACRLWERGYVLNLRAINNPSEQERPELLVDLPPYPWNHSTVYWQESRLSTDYRLRRYPRTDLLGALVTASLPAEPRWRNFLRTTENPWMRDHMVQDNIIYPGAGFLAMGIEAVHQHAVQSGIDPDLILGYRLREITLGQALIVPDDPGEVEVTLALRPYSESLQAVSNKWFEACVYSLTASGVWTEHCRGLISVEKRVASSEVNGERHSHIREARNKELLDKAKAVCHTKMDVRALYKAQADLGFIFGPTFRGMVDSRISATEKLALSTFEIQDTARTMPMNFQYPYIIHPATLDCVWHGIFSLMGSSKELDFRAPLIPRLFTDVYVSHKILTKPGTRFVAVTQASAKDFRSVSLKYHVFNEQDETCEPMITATGTSVALENDSTRHAQQATTLVTYQPVWKPDATLLTAGQQLSYESEQKTSQTQQDIRTIEEMAFYLMRQAVETVSPDEITEQHHKHFYTVMHQLIANAKDDIRGYPSSHWAAVSAREQADFNAHARLASSTAGLLYSIGSKLPEILRGEIDPLTIMATDSYLSGCYAEEPALISVCEGALPYLELLVNKVPDMKFLELGLCAEASARILKALNTNDRVPLYSAYEIAAPKSAFLKSVTERTGPPGSSVSVRETDLQADLPAQGFEENTYDVLVVSNTLLLTPDILLTLRLLKSLLKEGGKLLLLGEPTQQRLYSLATFGVLSEWWTNDKKAGPFLTREEWHSALTEAGFSHVQETSAAQPQMIPQFSNYYAEVPPLVAPRYPKDVTIVVGELVRGIDVEHLQSRLKDTDIESRVTTMSDMEQDADGKTIIVLEDLSGSMLSCPSPSQFDAYKKALPACSGAIWVSRGGTIEPRTPTANFFTGLAKSLRVENGSSTLISLTLDGRNPLTAKDAADVVLSVLRASFNLKKMEEGVTEVEYAERDGVLHIPRLVEDHEVNSALQKDSREPTPEDQEFIQKDCAFTLKVRRPGLLETIHFINDNRYSQPLPDEFIEVEVKATGMNFKDVMMAMGQIDVKELGLECAGVVTRIGDSAASSREQAGLDAIQVGDRVCVMCEAAYANYVRAPAGFVQKLPDAMPFEVGASIPVAYTTAYHSLINVARLQAGEVVLIHAASGALGQAVINVCHMIGAVVYATVGTKVKKELLMSRFNIPEDHIFTSRNATFAEPIMRATNGHGADVIVNPMAGELLRETWNCIAPFGRFIELGKRDFYVNTRLEMSRFAQNVMFAAVDMSLLASERSGTAAKVLQDVMVLMKKGKIVPTYPITTFSMSELEKALRTMQSGKHLGKLVVVPKADDIVKIISVEDDKHLLRADASYLLVGGLGGIGRAQAMWMWQHGARNLIFASRSGLVREEARTLVENLQVNGVKVAVFACDVSKEADVRHMLSESANIMPPIRGVIHGAMVIKSNLFANMTLDDWQQSLAPKVQGTWNLHNHLPKEGLDFFIMLSSVVGVIGNTGQAAYSAAGAFMDSFADYRRTLNLPATSIDLGKIDEIGYLAELPADDKLRTYFDKSGFRGLSAKEVMSLIKFAIKNPLRKGRSAQIVTGLGVPPPGQTIPGSEYSLFAHFRHFASRSSTSLNPNPTSTTPLRDSLRLAPILEEATHLLLDALIQKISLMLVRPAEEISPAKSMSSYGMDSLVGVEMRNWLNREVDVQMPILELLANQPLSGLAGKIVGRCRFVEGKVGGGGAAAEADADVVEGNTEGKVEEQGDKLGKGE